VPVPTCTISSIRGAKTGRVGRGWNLAGGTWPPLVSAAAVWRPAQQPPHGPSSEASGKPDGRHAWVHGGEGAHVPRQVAPQNVGGPALTHPARPCAQSTPTSEMIMRRHLAGSLIAVSSSACARHDFRQTAKFDPEYHAAMSRRTGSDNQMNESPARQRRIVCRNGRETYNDICREMLAPALQFLCPMATAPEIRSCVVVCDSPETA
jgi:hypothetical protein